jgi:hypothetical protein
LRQHPSVGLETENYAKPQSMSPASWPRYEPNISQILVYIVTAKPTRSVTKYVALKL